MWCQYFDFIFSCVHFWYVLMFTYILKETRTLHKTVNISFPVTKRPYFLSMAEIALQHAHKINEHSIVLSRVLGEIFTTKMTTFHCILCFCSIAVFHTTPTSSQGFLMLSLDSEECHNTAITLCWW